MRNLRRGADSLTAPNCSGQTVTGAGIAVALQAVIASLAGWVAIAFGRFYSTGDRIQLGGVKGDVIDIGILRTTLMEVGQWVDGDLYNGRIVRIANSFVFKEPVFNYSADFPFLWDEIKLPIRYGSGWAYTSTVLQRHSMRSAANLHCRVRPPGRRPGNAMRWRMPESNPSSRGGIGR